jgi:superfamily II DNA helicase RecQ
VREGLRLVFGDSNATEKSPEQLEYLVTCLEGIFDAVVVIPTGGGKSAAWLILSKLESRGISVVVCPFTLLLEDQVKSATEKGIIAAHYSATGPPLPEGVRIIFLQPETLRSRAFKT